MTGKPVNSKENLLETLFAAVSPFAYRPRSPECLVASGGVAPPRNLRMRCIPLLLVLACAPHTLAQEDADDPAEKPLANPAALVEQKVEAGVEQVGEWVDATHEKADSRTQDMVQWMDNFFGAPVADSERAESFLRTIIIDDWDERDSHDLKLRLRGQIDLPKISKRVDLLFSGEESEQSLSEDQRSEEDSVSLRFNFQDKKRLRLDGTLSARSGPALLPGVRACASPCCCQPVRWVSPWDRAAGWPGRSGFSAP